MKISTCLLSIAALCLPPLCLSGCPPEDDTDAIIDGIEFVWCPAGSFMMGRRGPGEEGSSATEDPSHQVTFSQGFWISKYEITQEQYEAVMGTNPSYFAIAGDHRPVDSVTWYDAVDFAETLTTLRPAFTFRLPSEAEWEYACRAGTTSRYYWGKDSTGGSMVNYAWGPANSNEMTHEVGQKLPNAWGIYDMSGNAWEWCQDTDHPSYTGAPADGSAWVSEPGLSRVVRGGSWYNPNGCRSAFRGWQTPTGEYTDYGIRIVRE